MDEKQIITPGIFDPAKFIGKGWTIWKGPADGDGLTGEEDIDPRSLVLTEVKLAKFVFETCLKSGENFITGEEKLRRQKEEKPGFIRFGGSVFYSLWLDYQDNKEKSVLEWLHRNFGVTFMDFMGQIFRNPFGGCSVLCLNRYDAGEWRWECHWLDYQWDADNPSVGCAS